MPLAPAIITSRTRRAYLAPPIGPVVANKDSPQYAGLVAWWPLNEQRGTRYERAAGGRWNLTENGTVDARSGPFGGGRASLWDAGSTDYLENQSVPAVTAVPLTMSCWFLAADVTNYYALMAVLKWANAGTDDYFSLGINGATTGDPVYAEVANGANYSGANSATGYLANTWNLAVGGFESATSRWATCNAASRGTNAASRTPVAASIDRTQLGSFVSQAGTFSPLNGQMFDARIYNRSISVAQNWALYDPATRWDLWYLPGRKLYSFAPAGGTNYTLTADAGAYTLTGSAATPRAARRLTADAGSYALTGSAATPRAARRVTAEAGAYTATGSTAGVTAARRVTAEAGAYALTGSAAGVYHNYPLTAAAGSYALTGAAAGLSAARLLLVNQERRFGSSAANAGSGIDWLNTGNVFATDGAFADTAELSGGESTKQLRVTGFGFAVPSSARISGVRVEVVREDGAGNDTCTDLTAQLVLSGSLIGTNAASGTAWPLAVATATYGGESNTLGATLAPADVNDSTFGFALAATCSALSALPRVDSVRVTVFYSMGYTVSGSAAGLYHNYPLAAGAGSYTLTGSAATLRAARTLASAAGAYTLTGSSAVLRAARTLAGAAGAYAVTGSAANVLHGFRLTSAAGAYALTGSDATLTAGGDSTLTADAGAYTLTGSAAGLTVARRLTGAAGSYALTGSAANVRAARLLTAAAGAYTLTGTDAGLRAARQLSAAAGAYALTGGAASINRVYTLAGGAGAYALTGSTAGFTFARQLTAEAGAYALTGSAVTFTVVGTVLLQLGGSFRRLATQSERAFRRTATQYPRAWGREDEQFPRTWRRVQ